MPRDGLLDAAFETLLDEGPSFGVGDVARRAGASKSLVFHHFRHREGLLVAMTTRVLAETQEGLARLDKDYPNPRERLEALARTLLEEPAEPPGRARRVFAFWLDERGALRDGLLAEFVEATRREGVATGAMRPGVSGPELAGLILVRWHGVSAVYAMGRPVDFAFEADRLVKELMELVTPSA